MKVGDVLPTKSIRVVHDTGWLNYKAPDGERFLVVLLGSEPVDGSRPLDPRAVFKELGWAPFAEEGPYIDAPVNPNKETQEIYDDDLQKLPNTDQYVIFERHEYDRTFRARLPKQTLKRAKTQA